MVESRGLGRPRKQLHGGGQWVAQEPRSRLGRQHARVAASRNVRGSGPLNLNSDRPRTARLACRHPLGENDVVPVPSFAMYDMGWYAFQQLCHTVLREVLGQTVQSFLATNDGGRDGAFRGTWAESGADETERSFVVQCKHTAKRDVNFTLSDVRDELAKVERLAASGDCDVYVLMTNAGLTGTSERAIRDAFRARGVGTVLTFGADWMNQTIAESSRLRRLVPRLYGLGDLTEILDERAYRQARAVLDSMRTDLDKLVLTSTYDRATEALERYGFVLLLGGAATGKTTIAAQLALGAADEFDTTVVKLDTAADFQSQWNPHERQLFWLDDAFGVTQLDLAATRAWTSTLSRINSAIRSGSKVVVTSRDYVFRAARSSLKPGSFPLFEEARVVVDVQDLRPEERSQILFNHLRHGLQPNRWIRSLTPQLDAVAAHQFFTPELARRLSHPHFTSEVLPWDAESVNDFFTRPEDFLHDVMAGLDFAAQAALGLIFAHHGWLPSPIDLDARSADLVHRLGSTLGGVVAALGTMDGSLVANIVRDGSNGWVFAHPTMGDAFSRLIRSPELLRHLLAGIAVRELIREITCGDVGIEGALIVGPRHYDLVLNRLDEPPAPDCDVKWRHHQHRYLFLATRCDAQFLAAWCARHPDAMSSLSNPGLLLEGDAGNTLVARLNRLGLYPEDLREIFASALIDYAVDGTDPAVLWDDDLKSTLTADEQVKLLDRVRGELLADLHTAISNCTDGYNQFDHDASSFIEPLTTLVEHLPGLFPEDDYVARRTRDLDTMIHAWVEENQSEPDDERFHTKTTAARNSDAVRTDRTRSIFDDLLTGRPDRA